MRALLAFVALTPTLALAGPAHTLPRPPDWYSNLHAGETVRLTYYVCAGDDGKVTSVQVIHGRRPIDDDLIAQIKSNWTNEPPGCKNTTFGFRFTGPQNLQSGDDLKLYDPAAPGPVGSYAFCIGKDGKVLDVRVLTSLGASDFLADVKIRGGQYEPRPEPTCVATRIVLDSRVLGGVVNAPPAAADVPDGGTDRPKMVAAFTLAGDQVDHPLPQLPAAFKNAHAHETVQATYKVCIDTNGHVSGVSAMSSLGQEAVDRVVMDQIEHGWTYKPQKVPVCFGARVKFTIN